MAHRGSEVAVDTSKFDSWPLLRPDELTSLPTEVLRASVTDLGTMCRHASGKGGDPVAGYARIQRERTSAILSERAAYARVQALLTGTEFVGRERLETAPSHGDARLAQNPVSSTHTGNFGGECYSANGEFPAAPEPTPSSRSGGMPRAAGAPDVAAQGVRSPPRLPQSAIGPLTVGTAAVAPVTTAAGAETNQERSGISSDGRKRHQYRSQVKGDVGQVAERPLGQHGRDPPDLKTFREHSAVPRSDSYVREAAPNTSQAGACDATEYTNPRQPDRFCGDGVPKNTSNSGANVASSFPSSMTTCTQHQHRNINQRGGGRAAPDRAIRDNWGSVFVVGGGRRRRRPPVRQRSSEAEDTPAARRAQVEKERQERRKASLHRLMARKEQRALQQEARRKRRAAAARKAAAAAAAAAAGVPGLAPAAPLSALPPAQSATEFGAAPSTACAYRREKAVREGTGGVDDGGGESFQQSQGGRCDDLVAEGEFGVGTSEVTAGRHKHQSNTGASADPKAGSPIASGAPLVAHHCVPAAASSGTASIADDRGPKGEGTTLMMSGTSPKQSGGEVDRSLGCSSGSESESVSGGDSSDDDDLFIEEIEEDGGVSTNSECGANSNYAGKPTDQAEKGLDKNGVVQQEVGWTSSVVDGDTPLRSALHRGPLRHESDHNVESAELARDDRAQDSPEKQKQQQQQNHQASSSEALPHAHISTEISSSGIPIGLGVAGGGRGGGDGAAGDHVTEVEAGGAAGGAEDDAEAAVVDSNTTSDNDELDSGSELEWEQGNTGTKNGNAAGVGGVDATELPGPLDVQPVVEVEPELGQVAIEARVLGTFGEAEQLAVTSPRSRMEVTTTLSSDGTDSALNVTPRAKGCTAQEAVPIVPLSREPCSKQDAGNARAETEATTDLDSVGASYPARYPRVTTANHHAGRDSDDDNCTKGKSNSSDGSTAPSTTALTPPRQHQRQASIASPHGTERRNLSSGLPPPNLQTESTNAEKSGDRSGFTTRCKQTDGIAPRSGVRRILTRYSDCYPRFAAVLSAHHNGRALTRPADCRSLPLTSRIMSRGRTGRALGDKGSGSGLTAAEEEACLRWQWKLYSIHVRVIKDYATVFSYGDGWSVNPSTDESNSLVYSGDASALHYRVNSKARPEVYNIVTDVLNNRCEQWEELPTGLGLKTTWNLLWTWSKPHIQYSSLLTWQKVNHFPNSRELTRKDLLNKHISRFMAPGGRLAKEFHIMPQTFVLPHEFTLFVSAFTASGRSQGAGRGTLDNAWRGSSDEDYNGGANESDNDWNGGRSRGSTRGVSAGKGKNLWIMKPVGMSRGRGIRLIDDIKNISYADKVVLQRYVGNPLLLDGYKFDLRLYVLVTSFNKLEAFIYKEGFARLSTHRYENGDIDNPFIHLTNSSIQRLNETGATQDSPLHHAKTFEAGGTKTTLSYLWRRLAASGVDVGALWAGICSVIVKSLVCVEGSIPNQPNSFELFGYDVLIDNRLRPWLIEVNSSPSMARDTHVDRQVKEALIFETVHLVDPLPFDRQKLVDVLGRRLSANENSKARPFKQHRDHHLHQPQQHGSPSETSGNAEEVGNISGRGQPPTTNGDHTHRPRRSKEEAELDRDLDGILCGRRPRRVGEPPARMGNFVRLCPGTAAHRHARRLRRRVVRPQPGDDDEPAAKT
eukprot:g9030.t1